MRVRIFFLLMIFSSYIMAQKVELNGYFTNMQSFMFSDLDGPWISDNLVHNRLNLFLYPNDKWTLSVQVRNRIFTGTSVQSAAFAESMNKDMGITDLSFHSVNEQSVLVNHCIDRAYLNFNGQKFEITAGRQRINWGQSFVWNPNDVFNTYSFFDFDYAEKPGADALRLQYYLSYASNVEIAAKWNNNQKATVAMRTVINAAGYDWQLMAALMNESDWVLGGAWTGNIKSVSFTCEFSYIFPKDSFSASQDLFLISSGFSYSFENSLMLQTEFLYASLDGSVRSFESFYYGDLSVKNLAFTEYNWFVQAAYPITPLLSANFSAMLYPQIKGFYLGPSFNYSLSDFADFGLILQSFSAEFTDINGDIKRQQYNFAFLRLKYSF